MRAKYKYSLLWIWGIHLEVKSTSEKALLRFLLSPFVCVTAEEWKASFCLIPVFSSFSHMTSARLSLTLFLCLVLALKAAELKRCYWRKSIFIIVQSVAFKAKHETRRKIMKTYKLHGQIVPVCRIEPESCCYLLKSWDLLAFDSSVQDERRAKAKDVSQ